MSSSPPSSQFLAKDGIRINKVDELCYMIEKDTARGIRVPVKIYADDQLVSSMTGDRTIGQAVNVAALPGAQKHVVVLPDGHEGYGFPIGGVAATDLEEGVVSPGGVGYDINCGVRLIRTDLTESDVKEAMDGLVNELFRAIPSGVGSKGTIRLSAAELDEIFLEGVRWAIDRGYGYERDAKVCEEEGHMKEADPSKVSETARKRGLRQLGSLGSGNHFLEVQKVDMIHDYVAAKAMGIEYEGQVTVLIHSGSRGLGHQICSDYLRVAERALDKYGIALPDKELACVPSNSKEGEDYRGAMNSALNFAWTNRQIITHWTRTTFKQVFSLTDSQLEGMKLVYDVAHNIAKVEKHRIDKEGGMSQVMVHRKGATRAFPKGMQEIPEVYRDLGQPVMLPGSMGTATWVLLGGKNSMELSFGSTAHGAGRIMSRTAAKRTYTAEKVKSSLRERGVTIRTLTRGGMVEETLEVYKDVDVVADVSHNLGIATKVARLVPLGVIKG
jgi:tRNA-splicing ligase RtcB (3'-phosphate/5'-hydroxy nucleic acid ligase)